MRGCKFLSKNMIKKPGMSPGMVPGRDRPLRGDRATVGVSHLLLQYFIGERSAAAPRPAGKRQNLPPGWRTSKNFTDGFLFLFVVSGRPRLLHVHANRWAAGTQSLGCDRSVYSSLNVARLCFTSFISSKRKKTRKLKCLFTFSLLPSQRIMFILSSI